MQRRITILRPALPVKCPTCGASISWRVAEPKVPFLCPSCHNGVRLRHSYFRVLNLISVGIVALLAYALGARGDTLFWIACFGWIPGTFVITFLTLRLFAPDAEATGEFRGILYGDPPQ